MAFSSPIYLLLLTFLVPIIWVGLPGRGHGRSRELLALAARVAIAALVVLALAGPELRRASDRLAVAFLLDRSDSVDAESRQAARSFVENALAEKRLDDQAAVILFGGDALVERPMSNDRRLGEFNSVPDTSHTDPGEAIRLAMALFPPNTGRRIVMLSDGRQTAGDLESAARLATDAGIDFVLVPLGTESPGGEVALVSFDLPGRMISGDQFEARIGIHAAGPGRSFLRIFGGGEVQFEGLVDLSEGTQHFNVPLVAEEPGFAFYKVQVSAADDVFLQNNELSAFTQIEGPPKVLLVVPPEGEALPTAGETRPDEGVHLQGALTASGFTVDRVRPAGLSFELPLLSEYAAIILVDVPARDLSSRQMEAVQSYVRDLGGGLIAVGGPTSYGVGGYFKTPLEEILPVDMEIKDQERRPSLTMVFIIDRSGSMGEASGGVSKLALAKEAAARSTELLFPGDKVGVIAFDDAASWVVPISEVSNAESIISKIDQIGIGGGTDILGGLQAMADVLPGDDSLVKHVILLTDGGASEQGIPNLVGNLFQQNGITLSAVGVGTDAAPFLEDVARVGGGRYHFTDRPESIPSIFTEETSLATRSYIVEETFFPTLLTQSQIVAGIQAVPALHGYVGASGKATAQVVLISELGDPILATWQYGLGKTAAWTSDSTARWARDWVTWEGFPVIWSQMVQSVAGELSPSPLEVLISHEGREALLSVNGLAIDGGFLNHYQVSANIVGPDGSVETLTLPQVAPGLYEGRFHPEAEGTYLVRVTGENPNGEEPLTSTNGWVKRYSQEYSPIIPQPAEDWIAQLLNTARGTRISLDDRESAFSHSLAVQESRLPIWPQLITIALLLLPFDIAMRRLAFDRQDFVRGWEKFTTRLAAAGAAGQVESPRSSRLDALFEARQRARRENEEAQSAAPQARPPSEREKKPKVFVRPDAAENEPPAAGQKQPAKTERTERDTTTSTLLARKRERQKRKK